MFCDAKSIRLTNPLSCMHMIAPILASSPTFSLEIKMSIFQPTIYIYNMGCQRIIILFVDIKIFEKQSQPLDIAMEDSVNVYFQVHNKFSLSLSLFILEDIFLVFWVLQLWSFFNCRFDVFYINSFGCLSHSMFYVLRKC